MEALAKLKPYFDRKFGTVTAGNSSQITDGGAATLVMSASAAKSRGYAPLGKILGFAFCALEPERMGLGPAVATPLALKHAGLAWSDIGLVEINEAFAAQAWAREVFPRRPGTRSTRRAARSARSTGRRQTSTEERSRSGIRSARRPIAS